MSESRPVWLAAERHLAGASLLRIALAVVVLYQLAGHWSERRLLWGPDGLYPLALFHRDLPAVGSPSFFAVQSPAAFDALYVFMAVVAVLFLAGWHTRWVGVWLYVLVWSLVKRNPLVTSGGDTLLLVMFPFVLLMNTAAYWSADSGWRRLGDAPPAASPLVALVHNVGLGAAWVQLAIFYGVAGVYKLFGERWADGTAVYHALRLQEFTLPGVSEHLYLQAPVVHLATYGTLAFEMSVPLLIWSRRTRWMIPLAAVGFHAAIAVLMGLVVFAAQALMFHLLLLDDERYRSIGAAISRATRADDARRV